MQTQAHLSIAVLLAEAWHAAWCFKPSRQQSPMPERASSSRCLPAKAAVRRQQLQGSWPECLLACPAQRVLQQGSRLQPPCLPAQRPLPLWLLQTSGGACQPRLGRCAACHPKSSICGKPAATTAVNKQESARGAAALWEQQQQVAGSSHRRRQSSVCMQQAWPEQPASPRAGSGALWVGKHLAVVPRLLDVVVVVVAELGVRTAAARAVNRLRGPGQLGSADVGSLG